MNFDKAGVEYAEQGMTVLRAAIPEALLRDLRAEAESATAVARQLGGPQAQRLLNLYATDGVRADRWRAFMDLPVLRGAVDAILSTEHQPTSLTSLLINPLDRPWLMPWHRDWLHNGRDVDEAVWLAAARNLAMFSQLNAALYDDDSLWFVPGSHARASTPAEQAVRDEWPQASVDDRPYEQLREVCRAMPMGEPVRLAAGDIALYRNCAWHAGLYSNDIKRATIHAWFGGPDDRHWHESRRAAGLDAGNHR